jgi:hypothetical protein
MDVEVVLSFVRRYVLFVGGALGVILLAAGVYFDPRTRGGTVLVAVGGAMVAAFVIALISLSRDDLLDRLFRQGVVEVFPSRVARCNDDYWRRLLERVSREYSVLGVANHGYTGTAQKRTRYEHLVRAAVERGVTVELLWLSPTAPVAPLREQEEGRATRADTVNSIVFFWEMRGRLSTHVRDRLVLREHEHVPSCGLTRADDVLTVTHYVPGQDNLDSPGWILTTTPYPFYRRALAFVTRADLSADLVEVYLNTYGEVQANSTKITQERVTELEARLPEYDVGKPSEADNRQANFPDDGPPRRG